jgi:glucose dehydrogenase
MGENIVLSPNPSNGIFNLSNADGKEIAVAVFNSLGQLVYQQKNHTALNSTINIQDQAAGIYFVKITSGGEEVIKKIVVAK